ncbi:MAG: molecular chaperone DnaJ [Alphaproteobacteria bacterium]
MSKKDYYETLGSTRSATQDELKKSYRKLAMKYHPDQNQGDETAEQKFKEINEAYDILRDDQKRAAYDQYGHSAFESGMGGGHHGGGHHGGGFSDIFSEVFGGGDFGGGGGRRRGQPNRRGGDLRYNMTVSMEEAFEGMQTKIDVPTQVNCEPCEGSGSEDQGGTKTCGTCGGQGVVHMRQGFFTIERACHSCDGQGQIIKNPCRKCSGTGRVHKNKKLSVNIPKGVSDGVRIRLSGEGEAGMRGAPGGDLYLFIRVKAHKIFEREGDHLFCHVPISLIKATLGGEIEVPTIEGKKAKMTIPKSTQTGKQFRLKGKGMSIMKRVSRGDLYIEVVVEVPTNLSKEQIKLFEELDKTMNLKKNLPDCETFSKKISR